MALLFSRLKPARLKHHISKTYFRTSHLSCKFDRWFKQCSFFGKSDELCFLETPVLRSILLPYYRRINDHPLFIFAYELYRSICIITTNDRIDRKKQLQFKNVIKHTQFLPQLENSHFIST